MLIFGAVALALAAIGLRGDRLRVSGASRRSGDASCTGTREHLLLLVQHGKVVTVAGIILGLGGAYAGGRFASTWLYAVQAWDAMILASALASVLVVS